MASNRFGPERIAVGIAEERPHPRLSRGQRAGGAVRRRRQRIKQGRAVEDPAGGVFQPLVIILRGGFLNSLLQRGAVLPMPSLREPVFFLSCAQIEPPPPRPLRPLRERSLALGQLRGLRALQPNRALLHIDAQLHETLSVELPPVIRS